MLAQNTITSIIDDNDDDVDDEDDGDDDDDNDDDDDDDDYQFFIKKKKSVHKLSHLTQPKFEVNCFLCLCFSPCFDWVAAQSENSSSYPIITAEYKP